MPFLAGEIVDPAEVAEAVDGWQAYSPLLYHNMTTTKASIARTVGGAHYIERAGFIVCQVDILAGANSTGGCGVQLPVNALAASPPLFGSAAITGSGAPTTPVLPMVISSLDAVVLMLPSTAYHDITNGQRVRFSIMYRSA